MVAEEELVRLARGVFIKYEEGMKMPTMQEIAEAKARAFGKLIIPTMRSLAKKHGLIKPKTVDRRRKECADDEGAAQFSVVGCKGDFKTIHGKVKFRSLAPRKFFLYQEKVGKTILAMWHASKIATYSKNNLQEKQKFSRSEKKKMMEFSAWAPSWLHYYLHPVPPRADIHAPWSLFPLIYKPPVGKPVTPVVREVGSKYEAKTAVKRNKICTIDDADCTSRGGVLVWLGRCAVPLRV
ncbi:MAG: hypothetical protein IAF58_18240 [Leptolyngbya sp.]|nr:hypothetical protein [Candidatus Melainabacteria bacterium]